MNQWSFVIAAYAVVGLGVAGLLAFAFVTMRRAERAADAVRRRR
ncbi:hypothetical protein [Sphingomonas edaphi]|nr:hypothetical protein [Sphingomonas edaphi]